MKGDIVYRVYGVHRGRDKDVYFAAYRTLAEAQARIEKLNQPSGVPGWPEKYHDRGFVIRETRVETDFEVPPLPKPRDRFYVRATPKSMGPGRWDYAIVEIFRRGQDNSPIFTFERSYSMLQTFEPFRQAGRDYALVSRDYTKTAVVDLATGKFVAEDSDQYYDKERTRSGAGFCPVGFYVPDWWDLHDASLIPGCEYWDKDKEWPTGEFGFVWGCHWGDDSSWKVQMLDLSRIRDGVLVRDDRFGYVELSTEGYESPVFQPALQRTPTRPPPFIRLWRDNGEVEVIFAVEMAFDLRTGRLDPDVRERLTEKP
jgi:hypothetical protein